MALCLECNGCIDNTCTECDDVVNPCAPCTEGDCHQCTCTTPAYTNVRCPEHIKTECIYWSGEDDECVGLVKNVTTLTAAILLIIDYIKTALTERILSTDGSITITPVDDDCDDKVDLSVKIDSTTNGGDNTLTLTLDGLYVPPPSGVVGGTIVTEDGDTIAFDGDGSIGDPLTAEAILDTVTGGGNNILEASANGLYVPPPDLSATICGNINSIFTDDVDQNNTADTDTYTFMALDDNDAGCNAILISPPLGFAVSGDDRFSAFGKMEWFSTLAAAITDAVSGETVILYADSSDALTLKAGVNFQGFGERIVSGTLTINANTNCKISNINFTNAVVNVGAGLTCKIFTSNVTVQGTMALRGSVKWFGGIFLDNTKTVSIIDDAQIHNAYIERTVAMAENAVLTGSKIIQTDNTASYGIYLNQTTAGTLTILKNCEVTTDAINAIMAISLGQTAKVLIQGCTGISVSGIGIYAHGGFTGGGGCISVTNSVGRSTSGHGMQIVSSASISPLDTENNTHYMTTNSYGYSVSGTGIYTINGNLKGCHGYSDTGWGIYLDGADAHTWNLLITECTAESHQNVGLLAARDCFILGGTFISMLNSSLGNPIRLTNYRPGDSGYMIVGAKTHAFSPLAYAIKGTAGLPSVRISGCQFTNQNVLTNVLGIDPLLTLRAVSIDAYGNAR